MKTSGFRLRSHVDDFAVFQNVVVANEYMLPPKFHPDSIVLDIGAHIGCFAMAAYTRGARKIYCYEADAHNFKLLEENISTFKEGNVVARRAAVWRSDKEGSVHLPFTPSEDLRYGGGGNVILDKQTSVQWVPSISFDAVVDKATDFNRKRVFMVKFDCEGSEWPILLTSRRLDLIDWIVGEYHEIGGPHMGYVKPDQAHPVEIPEAAKVNGWGAYTIENVSKYLEGRGFNVTFAASQRHPWLGKFWAVKK